MNTKKMSLIASLTIVILLTFSFILVIRKKPNENAMLNFSKDSGFYENEIKLSLKPSKKGATIYYTLDGSTPTLESEKYTSPITLVDRTPEKNVLSSKDDTSFFDKYIPKVDIQKATVVRAFEEYKDGTTSEIITKTYFIGKQFVEKYKNIPVLSISINPEYLFDKTYGIYVKGKVYEDWVKDGGDLDNTPTWELPANFTQIGREWERPMHLEFFENGKATSLSQDLGLRIMGGASRGNEQKTLKFYARKDYGKGSVDYELFPGDTKNIDKETPLHTYDTFAVRTGGNDGWTTKFRHRYIQLLVNDRAFTTQQTRPVVVFINGEYWGLYTMQDDYSDNYIYRNYDIDKKNVIMIKRDLMEEGTDADRPLYDDMINFAEKNDMAQAANYEKICEMVDIQSLIDYFATEIYIVNGDWLNHENNYRLWRTRETSNKPYEDGKWRYMLYDSEYSMGIYSQGKDYDVNSLKDAMTISAYCPGYQVKLFRNLLKNETFKKQFVNTFMDLVNENFKKERLYSLLDQMVKEYEPYMPDYFDRFGNLPEQEREDKMSAFYDGVEELKVFLDNRNDYIPKMLKDTLALKGEAVDLTVSVNDANKGNVQIGTITPDFSKNDFNGTYFTDFPVTLTAAPKDGYVFKGWTGDVENTESTIDIIPGEVKNVQAVFEKK